MRFSANHRRWATAGAWCVGALFIGTLAYAAIIELTMVDLHLRGTQMGAVGPATIHPEQTSVTLALEELEFFSVHLRILGTYPAHPFRAQIAEPASNALLRPTRAH